MRSLLFLVLLVSLLAAACDAAAVPTIPPITVVITAVDDTEALSDGIAQALTGTAQVFIGATETVLAQGGVTLTPSPTHTLTPTVPARPTRPASPTPTLTPTVTPTPTFAPFLTITPETVEGDTAGWLRVVHAWPGSTTAPASVFDIYINGEAVYRSLRAGQQTPFQQFAPGAVEVALKVAGSDIPGIITRPPALSQVVQIQPGKNTSLLVMATTTGSKLVIVEEDAAPLPTGTSRLTVVQANPQLFTTNLLMPDLQRALAYNINPGDIIGPLDMPSGQDLLIDLYDARNPELLIANLPPVTLVSRVSYLLVLVPSGDERLTGSLLFSGSTRTLPGQSHARFINLTSAAGSFRVFLNNNLEFGSLPAGVSDALPISSTSTELLLKNPEEYELAKVAIGPWTTEEEQQADKLILLYDVEATTPTNSVGVSVFTQSAPRSAINANVRLVHGLPGVIPLNLEMRPVRLITETNQFGTPQARQIGEADLPWVNVAQAEFARVSPYVARTPEIFEVRVVLSGTRNVIAQMSNVQLIAGGVYDFIVLPGDEAGSARLELVQPRAQVAADKGDPAAVAEAVEATLTAIAPVATATATRVSSPTPTRTPVPTNTPRPTNTPSVKPPTISADPQPPDTVGDVFVLYGQGFLPQRAFSVRLDNSIEPILTSVTNADGTITTLVNLPGGVSPGVHVVRVCVGTCPGSGQEALTIIRIASPGMTPTATRLP
ncbi:MAG: DUF4397 domain-containing protein [Chloroflexi bacterium]|nr:DUF4397 domain-containing protein [Chloroflexota bacterium]